MLNCGTTTGFCVVMATVAAFGCGDGGNTSDGDPMDVITTGEMGGESAATEEFDPQVPPTTADAMGQWLKAFTSEGWEADWVCEATETKKTAGTPGIHVHGAMNRVCSNQALAGATLSPGGALPIGAAALKFVGSGTYVEVKVEADSAAGQGWFWYAPGGAVAARGAVDCVGCHGAAGSDADHPGLGDYVYFRVSP